MNGATAWNPASARAGNRCCQVWAVSGNPCRQSASGPDPASSSPNSRSLARTVVMRNGTGAVMGDTLPAVRAPYLAGPDGMMRWRSPPNGPGVKYGPSWLVPAVADSTYACRVARAGPWLIDRGDLVAALDRA